MSITVYWLPANIVTVTVLSWQLWRNSAVYRCLEVTWSENSTVSNTVDLAEPVRSSLKSLCRGSQETEALIEISDECLNRKGP